MPPLPWESIARIRYATDEPMPEHATGFFARTAKFGDVCITAGHVFMPGRYRGPKDPKVVLVNGRVAQLVFDAYSAHGIDIAVVSIPADLPPEHVHLHRLGVSVKSGAFFAHAWSGSKDDPDELEPAKIWGVRSKLEPSCDRKINPRVARDAARWRLESHVAKPPMPFDTAFFQTGWSGAPVFNVCRDERPYVIGILSKHVGDRDAKAVSIESLDFLDPRAPNADANEYMPPFLNPKLQKAFEQAYRGSLSRHEIARLKYEEIAGKPLVMKIVAPPSPYDREETATAIA
jgi:hypothetical protein